jgi:hypothetical protein
MEPAQERAATRETNMRTSKFTIAARKRQLRDLLVTRKITRKRYAELRHADRVYYMQARRGVWDYIDSGCP